MIMYRDASMYQRCTLFFLLLFLFSCTDQKQNEASQAHSPARSGDFNDPPRPVMQKSNSDKRPTNTALPSRSDSPFYENCERDILNASIFYSKNIRLNLSPDSGISADYVKKQISYVFYFLISDFGRPLIPANKVEVRVYRGGSGNAFMERQKGGRRVIKIDPINFSEFHKMYIVHEFFHAFYQSDSFIDGKKIKEIEGWAVYAQLRYRFLEKSNKELFTYIDKEYGISDEDYLKLSEKGPWKSFPPDVQQLIYYNSAKHSFSYSHKENLSYLTTENPGQMVQTPCSPKSDKRNPSPAPIKPATGSAPAAPPSGYRPG